MDPDSESLKSMRNWYDMEEIRIMNLEWDEDDRRTNRLAAKKAALKTEAEKRAKIQANVDRALAERRAAEKAAEASNEKAAVETAAEASNNESPKKRLQNKTSLRRLLKKVETTTDEGAVSQDTVEDSNMSDDFDAVAAHEKAISELTELFADEPIELQMILEVIRLNQSNASEELAVEVPSLEVAAMVVPDPKAAVEVASPENNASEKPAVEVLSLEVNPMVTPDPEAAVEVSSPERAPGSVSPVVIPDAEKADAPSPEKAPVVVSPAVAMAHVVDGGGEGLLGRRDGQPPRIIRMNSDGSMPFRQGAKDLHSNTFCGVLRRSPQTKIRSHD